MSVATVSDMVVMIPELTSVSSGTVQSHLDDAILLITLDGIETTHTYFKILHKYKTASLLSETGTIKEIAGESVSDVSVSYSQSSLTTNFKNEYDRMYRQLKDSILGICYKIL